MAQFESKDPGKVTNTTNLNQSTPDFCPKPEKIQHILISSPQAVTSTIHYLQILGYANVGDWSPLEPTANPGEVKSILIRQILTQ